MTNNVVADASVDTRPSRGFRAVDLVDLRVAAPVLAVFAVATGLVLGVWRPAGAGPVALAIALLVVLAFAALSISVRATAVRVGRIADVAREHAEGRLTARVGDARKDRLGNFGRELDSVFDRERVMVAHVQRLAQRCEIEADETFRLGDAILNAAESTASDAASAATAAAAVSTNMHLVAAASEELTAAVREVAMHAVHASDTAGGATRDADATSDTMRRLSDTSQRVGEVVDFIRYIAKQTHMLALNASIEASRAGTSGAGFAVVAGDVKALASKTASATDSVGKSVTELLSDSTTARESISGIAEVINRVNENQVAIAASVEEQIATTNQISRAALESADASAGIAQNISDLAAAIRRMAYEGAQADTKAGDMRQLQNDMEMLIAGLDIGENELPEAGVKEEVAKREAETVNGVTRIEDYVMGNGLNEIEYSGSWSHSDANALVGGTNSYTVMPDDVAVLRFEGTRVRAYVVTQHNQGLIGVTLDDHPEVMFDAFSPQRQRGVLAFDSGTITPGRHTLKVRATGMKGEKSTFFWTSLDFFEVM